MKRDLNDKWLRALARPQAGRIEIGDTRTPGLVLRLPSAGDGTWALRARTRDGRPTRVKLGEWPTLGIKAAREAAVAELARIQRGADPVAEKRAAQATRKAEEAAATIPEAETVTGRLVAWQEARKADPAAPWSPRYAAEIERVCKQAIVPTLGARALRDTTREDWTSIIRDRRRQVVKPKAPRKPGEKGRAGAPAKDGVGAAAFLYRTISAFLNFAEVQGWIAAPLLPRKGAGLIAPQPAARERTLTDAELAAVWRAAEREPPKLRAFMRLLILTGARELEVADVEAGELDREAGRWSIPGARTKNGIGYTVPLSPLALAELRAVWPEEEPEAGHKLLGRVKGSGFRGFGKLKLRVDAFLAKQAREAGAAPPAPWRWHDLRRTARTGMTRLGVPRDHAEAAINHVSGRSKLERIYDRHDYAPEVLAALTLWQGHVAGLVGQGAELVTLATRRAAG